MKLDQASFSNSASTTAWLHYMFIQSILCVFFSPQPTIDWRRSGKSLPGGRYHINNFDSELIITNIQPSDEGVYICKGTNSAGVTEQNIYVDVQGINAWA